MTYKENVFLFAAIAGCGIGIFGSLVAMLSSPNFVQGLFTTVPCLLVGIASGAYIKTVAEKQGW